MQQQQHVDGSVHSEHQCVFAGTMRSRRRRQRTSFGLLRGGGGGGEGLTQQGGKHHVVARRDNGDVEFCGVDVSCQPGAAPARPQDHQPLPAGGGGGGSRVRRHEVAEGAGRCLHQVRAAGTGAPAACMPPQGETNACREAAEQTLAAAAAAAAAAASAALSVHPSTPPHRPVVKGIGAPAPCFSPLCTLVCSLPRRGGEGIPAGFPVCVTGRQHAGTGGMPATCVTVTTA